MSKGTLGSWKKDKERKKIRIDARRGTTWTQRKATLLGAIFAENMVLILELRHQR
jgi:hypothetical protein